jgi:phage head maturation protease
MSRQIYRDGLLRMAPFQVREAEGDGGEDGLTLEGHAAVFGARTVINSWEGRFTEELAPGAFRKTFRERTPVLQFDHGSHPLLGSFPLGRFIDSTPKEDEVGAFVRARLF